MIGLGGMVILASEFMFLASVQGLNSSTAMACYSSSVVIGIPLDYILSGGNGVNIFFLVLGCLLILAGLASLIAAEYFMELKSSATYKAIPESVQEEKLDNVTSAPQ